MGQDRPDPTGRRRVLIFATYTVVALGVALVLAQLEGGFVAGVAGFILGMIFVPVLVFNLTQAGLFLLPLVIVPLVVMGVAGASPFALINAAAWIGGGAAFAFGFAYLLDNVNRRAFQLERLLEDERQRSEALLLNILPAAIAERLKAGADIRTVDVHSGAVSSHFLLSWPIFSDITEPRAIGWVFPYLTISRTCDRRMVAVFEMRPPGRKEPGSDQSVRQAPWPLIGNRRGRYQPDNAELMGTRLYHVRKSQFSVVAGP